MTQPHHQSTPSRAFVTTQARDPVCPTGAAEVNIRGPCSEGPLWDVPGTPALSQMQAESVILVQGDVPLTTNNSDTVGSLGDRTRSYRLKSQSYKTTPTSSANSMSRLSLVFWTGCKSEVLVSLPWGIARAAYRTQRNILLTRPPIDYKRI